MRCSEAELRFQQTLDEHGDLRVDRELQAHLRECPECREIFEGFLCLSESLPLSSKSRVTRTSRSPELAVDAAPTLRLSDAIEVHVGTGLAVVAVVVLVVVAPLMTWRSSESLTRSRQTTTHEHIVTFEEREAAIQPPAIAMIPTTYARLAEDWGRQLNLSHLSLADPFMKISENVVRPVAYSAVDVGMSPMMQATLYREPLQGCVWPVMDSLALTWSTIRKTIPAGTRSEAQESS